jgi:hypothetical protein
MGTVAEDTLMRPARRPSRSDKCVPLYRLSDILERAEAVRQAENRYWSHATRENRDELIRLLDRLVFRAAAMVDGLTA